ncbi:MAG: GNAT family N-acetyltransferase [Janthinobacterium lividum]
MVHADVLAAIHCAAFPPAERWDAGAIAALLATPGCFALLADVGGMAMLRLAGDEAEVLTLAVLPAARGRGVGGALLAAGLAEAARLGAAAVLLEVAPGNAAARALYARAGFGEVGRRRGYYPGGGDALVMRQEGRALPGPAKGRGAL